MGSTGKGNWPLYLVWVIIFISTIAITLFYSLDSSSFYGISETREIVVNLETAAEIKRINVTEGEFVEEGMLLVELNSPELIMQINQISHQLDQLKAQKGVDKSEIRSRIRQLNAEKCAKENEIQNKISQLENQYLLNKSLISQLKSISKSNVKGSMKGVSPIELQINSLKQELKLSVNPLKIQIELLRKTLENSDDPVKIQVERLEKELTLLNDENNKLKIYAKISGIIGSVNFKAGEKVSPFSPILTLHTKTPSFIKGYIYENAYSSIGMGDCVNVASIAVKNNIVKGCVVGVGARIVEYPVRLRKNPSFQIWGREIVIQIPSDNNFILGEKVLITSSDPKPGFAETIKKIFVESESIAGTNKHTEESVSELRELPFIPVKKNNIEASAILYLDDIDRYLILSDDTPGDEPILYLVNSSGRMVEEVKIDGLGKINDLESVTPGNNDVLYMASSLYKAQKKKLTRFLVSVRREGRSFSLIGKTDLYSVLKSCAEAAPGKKWADFIMEGVKKDHLNIEGMFYKNKDLYLGFKAPLFKGRSVVLRLRDIDEIIKTGKVVPEKVSLWKLIELKDSSPMIQERISDMYYKGDKLYITGSPRIKLAGKRTGSLWEIDNVTDKLNRVAVFKGLKPEGIADGEYSESLMVCFDQGRGESSKMKNVKVK